MSFYDRKTLVILSVLWYLVRGNLTTHKSKVLKHIERIQYYYKINMKKRDHRWIRNKVNQFNVSLRSLKFESNETIIIALLCIVAERYVNLLKNPQRVTAWEVLETYCSKILPNFKIENQHDYDVVDKFNDYLFNDCLYLK